MILVMRVIGGKYKGCRLKCPKGRTIRPAPDRLKEAVFKALDISSDHWLDVEVRYSKSGKPSVVLSPSVEPKGSFSVDCSVSHAGAYTVAVVIFLLQDKH